MTGHPHAVTARPPRRTARQDANAAPAHIESHTNAPAGIAHLTCTVTPSGDPRALARLARAIMNTTRESLSAERPSAYGTANPTMGRASARSA